MFAEVIVLTKTQKNLETFFYFIPDSIKEKIEIGQFVLVPFGPRRIKGLVIKIDKTCIISRTKPILKILESSPLKKNFIKLAFWISWYYHNPIGLVIKTMLPPEGKLKTEKIIKPILPSQKYIMKFNELKKSPKQKQIIWFLMQNRKPQKLKEIISKFKTSQTVIKNLEEKKLIKIQNKKIEEKNLKPSTSIFQSISLSSEEKKIINIIEESLNKKTRKVFLLHTINYSEKIKIYSEIIQKILKQKKQIIIIAPEIASISKLFFEIGKKFGNQVAIFHSNISSNLKFKNWKKIKEGKINIIVGSFSALYAPVEKLGIIIIDHEHRPNFKFKKNFYYNLKEATIKFSELEKIPVVLQSFTPSVESYYNTRKENTYLNIIKKNKLLQMPQIQIVDLKSEAKKGNRNILSQELQKEIEKTLNKKQKIILFLNRRGESTFIICQECGHVLKCKNCDVPLTFHIQSSFNYLICHHCDYKIKPENTCPKCQGHKIRYYGIGIQKVTQEVKKIFPKAQILQVDSDIIKTKKDYVKVYDKIEKDKIDILIGTQILTSRFKLPKIDLIGIISLDILLNLPDFRSEEKTFRQIIELSEIAKRKIILQTYSPNNFAIQKASKYDFKEFYNKEIEKRKKLQYPPFVQLIKLVYSHKDVKQSQQEAERLHKLLYVKSKKLKTEDQISILGHTPCFIQKIKGNYQYQIIIKGKNIHSLLNFVPSTWTVDIDPESLL